MRKVKFKKWIPVERESMPECEACTQQVKGTGCFEKGFSNEGLFHQWVVAYEEFETGAGNYTIAIVETPSGDIVEVIPSNIIFI